MNKNSVPSLSAEYLLFVIGLAAGTALSVPSTALGAENVITCQTNQDTSIEYGDIVNCSIEFVGDTDLIRFSGAIGETILLQTSRLTTTGNPFVDLFDPDGARIAGGLNPFQVTLNQTGLYTVEVSEFVNDATVDYAFTVERIAPPSPTARQIQYGQTLNDTISPIVDTDPFFFHGTAGDQVSISAARLTTTGNPFVDLHAPDGARIAGGLNPFQVTLNQTGPHTIIINEFVNDATVNYALTIQCVSGNCTVVPIPDVEGCIDLKGSPLQGRRVELRQPNETTQVTTTNIRGCYKFATVRTGKSFTVRILGPTVN